MGVWERENDTGSQKAAWRKLVKIADVVTKAAVDLRVEIKKLASKRPVSVEEIAEETSCTPSAVRGAIKNLKASGANFINVGDKLLLHNLIDRGGHLVVRPGATGKSEFGFVTDKHLNNKHQRLDVLNAAYDDFERSGISDVFDAGNWTDGEARFNRQELINFGMDRQLDYVIDVHPQRKGITTYFVSGDDHEGWYSQRECINVGQYLQLKAEKAGRYDLKFIGHVESDVELKGKSGSAVMKVMHPGGGSAYAFSYAPQKIVESFQGGEKPAIVLGGHYHKFDYCFPREVHFISGGCLVDQTMFMRKNKIAAHVGYSKIRVEQDTRDGHITAVDLAWRPFYDRKFYERRFE
jgi:biotin operon repressor